MYYASRGKRANPVMDKSSKVTESQNICEFRGIKCYCIKLNKTKGLGLLLILL